MLKANLSYVIKRYLMNVIFEKINFAFINVNQLQICFSAVLAHKTLLCLSSVILSVKMLS